jgi:hypothetical protein
MTSDDIDGQPVFGSLYWSQEKVDGANCGMGWTEDGPLIRNRSKILNKSFDGRKHTPAKKQWTPAWNWAYEHEEGIREITTRYGSPLTIYGEWLWAEHSLHYEMLPDWFLAYDLWDGREQKFLAPEAAAELFVDTGISWIPSFPVTLTPESIQQEIDMPSGYRCGIREGSVFKSVQSTGNALWVGQAFKVVRADFDRQTDDWNERPMKRNRLK